MRENALGRGCERGRAIGGNQRRRIGQSLRHSIASAPCPGAGGLSSGSSSDVMREACRIASADAAMMSASHRPASSKRRRASMSPRRA
jgi:hypothetical protein